MAAMDTPQDRQAIASLGPMVSNDADFGIDPDQGSMIPDGRHPAPFHRGVNAYNYPTRHWRRRKCKIISDVRKDTPA